MNVITATTDRAELQALEAHSIYIMREVVAERERPCLLFSGGKDSAVLLRLAEKAFWPGPIPFPVMHVDTGHNFPEVIDFRDRRVAELGVSLVVASVQDAIDGGRVADPGPLASRNRLQSTALLESIASNRFDACMGGARRDEDPVRAKERVVSVRDAFGQWDPRRQRPELWSCFNFETAPGENLRVFPLADWTELDVWEYVAEEGLELPSIYYAHSRALVERDGLLLPISQWLQPGPGERVITEVVRFRTVGDMTCSGAVRSPASDPAGVMVEVVEATVSERGAGRADDRTSESAMEDRKREGYF